MTFTLLFYLIVVWQRHTSSIKLVTIRTCTHLSHLRRSWYITCTSAHLLPNCALKNTREWICNINTAGSIEDNGSESVVNEILTILFKLQCVGNGMYSYCTKHKRIFPTRETNCIRCLYIYIYIYILCNCSKAICQNKKKSSPSWNGIFVYQVTWLTKDSLHCGWELALHKINWHRNISICRFYV